MKFQLIDKAKNEFPVHRLCGVPGVSQSGYFAWKDRSGSRRQRDDMVLLARSIRVRTVERHLWQSADDARAAG